MRKDHRRELYSPASPEAGQLPDAVGPDGVRVTLRAEPAIDRVRRWRFLFFTPPVLTDPARAYAGYRVAPGLVQRYLLRDRWAVDVEADNGERCRIPAKDRAAAVDYARQVHAGVEEQGVAFLRTFAR
ncbi:hypothetical protein [Nocardioides sp. W7]|uniref:hypothetical protein n=1 Tax=Nocardioides sp. W7 TaxID=2931390 RepID=UPI001FD16AE2|nr:hypothetical protein [Nocardioides sp. W7]